MAYGHATYRSRAIRAPRGRILRIAFLVLLLTGRCIGATQQTEELAVRSWQTLSAFPYPTVQAFAQTQDGALWIGTRNGLVRFDGTTFEVFSPENTPALAEENVQCLFVSRNGRLWIGTAGTNGGGVVLYTHGKFSRFATAPGIDVSYVRQIVEDISGRIWVAADRGFYWVNHDRLETVKVSFGPGEKAHAPMLVDGRGRFWVTTGSRLYQVSVSGAVRFPLSEDPIKDRSHTLLATRDGSVLLGTDGGLWRLAPNASHFNLVPGSPRLIYSLAETPESDVWIGTADSGLYRQQMGRKSIEPFYTGSAALSRTVFALFTDRDGDLWVGTFTGLMRVNPTALHVLRFKGAGDSDMASVFADQDGSLWWSSGRLFHVVNGIVHAVKVPGKSDVRIRTVARGLDGTFWIGTEGDGVYAESQKQSRHFTTRMGLSTDFVRALLVSRTGTVWVGGDADGLTEIDGSVLRRYGVSAGLVYPTVRCLLEDFHGTLWIGTEHGLSEFRQGQFVHDAITSALRNEKIWSLLEDDDGGMWLGTRGNGLFRIREKKVFHFTYLNGLADNQVFSLLQDDHHHLWVSGPSGVSLFDRKELEAFAEGSSTLPTRHDFSVAESDTPVQLQGGIQFAGAVTKEEAWFPTNKGLWHIHPQQQATPRLTTVELVCRLDDRAVPCDTTLHVEAETKRIEVALSPIFLRGQNEIHVRYQLSGYDRVWNTLAPQQRVITYEGLPAGAYKLYIQTWSSATPNERVNQMLRIKKLRPIWQTPWLILSVLVALSLAILLVHRLHLRRAETRFQAVLAERERLAREMHDTLIQGCVGVSSLLRAAVSDEVDDDETREHLIEYASTQLQITVSEARWAVWNLRNEQTESADLRTALLNLLKKFQQNHTISVSVSVDGQQFDLLPQAVHDILMITREALFNATQHGSASEVRIHLRYSGSAVQMKISDNGKGFDDSSDAPDEHFGIVGMRERIHRWNGDLKINSEAGSGADLQIVCEGVRAARQTR